MTDKVVYKNKCGSCANYEPNIDKNGEPMKSGKCFVRRIGIHHYARNKACLNYKENKQ